MFNQNPKQILQRINEAVAFAFDNRVSLRNPKLDKNTLRDIGYSDASSANNADLSKQLDLICFPEEDTGAVIPIPFKSYKAGRVTRSVMAGEVIDFSDLFDVVGVLSVEIEALFGTNVPVQLLNDSKSLFDVISKGSRTSEKRMMLDIAAAREGFRDKVISNICFVRSSSKIADGLTKVMQQSSLQKVLMTGR